MSPDNKQLVNGVSEEHKNNKTNKKNMSSAFLEMNGSPNSISPLSLLADVATHMDETNKNSSSGKLSKKGGGPNNGDLDGDKKTPSNCSTLRELLTKTAKINNQAVVENSSKKAPILTSTLDDIIQQVVERNLDKSLPPIQLMHYIPRNGAQLQPRESRIPIYTLSETSLLFPDVPHSWLDNGKLLRLHDGRHTGNLKLFQQQWCRAQVSGFKIL
jgi:lysine-specific demethylase 3